MHAIYYPPADHETQWYGQGNYTMPGITKLLLHTTEGTGWPGYDGGLKAPTLTLHPGLHKWRQHFPLNGSARALRDPDSTPVRENRDNVVQVEVIGFADKSPYWDDWTLSAIADLWAFLNLEWGTPLTVATKWVPPTPWGTDDQRMTSAEYDAFEGLCGHEHASGNDHRDPGKPEVQIIASLAKQKTSTVGDDGDMTGQESARLNWIYGAYIDSDGSPSVTTLLAAQAKALQAIADAQAAQTAILERIATKLGA